MFVVENFANRFLYYHLLKPVPINVDGDSLLKCDDSTDKSDDAAVDERDVKTDQPWDCHQVCQCVRVQVTRHLNIVFVSVLFAISYQKQRNDKKRGMAPGAHRRTGMHKQHQKDCQQTGRGVWR